MVTSENVRPALHHYDIMISDLFASAPWIIHTPKYSFVLYLSSHFSTRFTTPQVLYVYKNAIKPYTDSLSARLSDLWSLGCSLDKSSCLDCRAKYSFHLNCGPIERVRICPHLSTWIVMSSEKLSPRTIILSILRKIESDGATKFIFSARYLIHWVQYTTEFIN